MTYEDARRVWLLIAAIGAMSALPDDMAAKGPGLALLNAELVAVPADVREAIQRGEMPREVWE